MVFSEPAFLFLFLPLALAVVLAAMILRRAHCAAIFMVSLAFYYWSSGLLVVVLLGCVATNWALARLLAWRRRPLWLIIGLAANLGTLFMFKYSYFAVLNLDLATGGDYSLALSYIALPIGISFFTFQGVSYLVDVWRGDAEAEPSVVVVGAYLTFFPQLIAGPIVRLRDVIEQYRKPQPGWELAAYGARRFAHGLIKKVLIADSVAPVADACFAVSADGLTATAAWLGALAFAVQIYFDFSGYSDMAIGLAAICGITLRENFERPYASGTVTEFWRRWHISLSSWFRDYLYIPLGGNRGGAMVVYRNLLLVFLATGLWHGAAWHFLAWGCFHGTFLVLERVVVARERLARAGLVARFVYLLPVVVLGWVLFRAPTLHAALDYWRAMFSPHASAPGFLPDGVLKVLTPTTAVVLLAGIACMALPRAPTAAHWLRREVSLHVEIARVAYICLGLCACGGIVLAGDFSPFLYFRF